MWKKIFLLLIFYCWFTAAQSQHIQKAQSMAGQLIVENKHLAKNKVKSVLETKSFSYNSSNEEGESYLFDRKGNLTEKRRYTFTNALTGPFYFIWKFTYNKQNKLLKATQIASNEESKVYWEDYYYDKKKQVILVTGHSNSESNALRKVEHFYNKKARNIKTIWYEPDSLILFTHLNTFDKQGNKLQTTTVWGPWKIEWVEVRNGKEIDPEKEVAEESEEAFRETNETESYLKEEIEETLETESVYIAKKVKQEPDSSTVFWKYNAKGNLVECTSGSAPYFYKVIYEYNQKDQLVETRQMDKNSRVYHKETFQYNKAGLLIAMDEYYDADKPAIYHKYTYTFY